MSYQVQLLGAVQTAYVNYTSYTLSAANTNLITVWPTPYATATNVLAFTTNLVVTQTGCTLTLPNANEVSLGMNIYVVNDATSTQNVTVLNNVGTDITEIAPGDVWWIQLTAYTNDNGGTWFPIQQGAGTSQATAAQLAGYGLEAVSSKLDTIIPPQIKTSSYTLAATDQSSILVFNSSGLSDLTLTPMRGGWDFSVNNVGSGTVTFTNGTVNNQANFSLSAGQTAIFINDATNTNNWWTLGLGQATSFLNSVVNIDLLSVAGGGSLTLTPAQINGFIQQFYVSSGAPITGDVTIYYGNSQGNWYVSNLCTLNGGTLSLRLGTQTSPVGTAQTLAQGYKLIYYSASDPSTLALTGLTQIPSIDVLQTTKVLLQNGTIPYDTLNPNTTGPSLTFSTDPTSGIYLPSFYNPTVTANGVNILTCSGATAATPTLIMHEGGTYFTEILCSSTACTLSQTVTGNNAYFSITPATNSGTFTFHSAGPALASVQTSGSGVALLANNGANQVTMTLNSTGATGSLLLSNGSGGQISLGCSTTSATISGAALAMTITNTGTVTFAQNTQTLNALLPVPPGNGSFLTWNSTAWSATAAPATAGQLFNWNGTVWQLTVAPAGVGSVHYWNGTNWASTAVPVAAGQHLIWNGTSWQPQGTPTGTGSVLWWNGAAWTSTNAPSAPGQTLQWNGTSVGWA